MSKHRSKPSPDITLCMIARDEKEFIADCIKSVRGLAREIVVIDTGSTDGTIEIAQSLGARVVEHPWTDSYAEARNRSLEYASSEWILILDADETLDRRSIETVRKAVAQPTADAYTLLFHNYRTAGATTPDITHRACRLFRNRGDYRFQGRVHERIAPSVSAAGGAIADLDAIIHHYGYREDLKLARSKRERYMSLLSAELAEHPGDPYTLSNTAAAMCAGGDFATALPLLERLTQACKHNDDISQQAFSRLADAHLSLGMPEKALAAAEQAGRLGVCHPQIEFTRGSALLALKRFDDALASFEFAVELGSQGTWVGDPATWGYEAIHGAACALYALGDMKGAAAHARRVLELNSTHAQAQQMLEATARDRPRISLCMIVRDEESFIADCLSSASDAADEVIVVDTGSNDSTPHIARSLGAFVHTYVWNDDFSAARNACIERASGDWILILDADERLDAEAVRSIRNAVEHPDVDAYQLLQLSYLGTANNAATTQCATCRLFRNRPEYRYEGSIHEHVLPAIRRAGGTVHYLNAIIHHQGYQPDVVDRQGKHEKYVRMLLTALANEPGSLYYMHTLAAAYCAAREYTDALPWLEECAREVTAEHEFAAQVHCQLATVYQMLNRPDDVISVADRALRRNFIHPTLHFAKGHALLALGRYEEAISEFENALRVGASAVWNGDTGTYGYKSLLGIASAYAEMGNETAAEEHFLKCLESKPNCTTALTDLGRLYAQRGECERAANCYSRAIEADPEYANAYFNAGDLLYALGQFQQAADLLQAGLLRNPLHAPAFFALGNCCFQLSAYEAAAQAYRQALELDSGYSDARHNLALAEAHIASQAA